MKAKPVRVCDVSRVLRISSASLISFLRENGYNVRGDFRSPLSSRMVELIQNGYHEGPPFQELNPFLPQAEKWEKLHADVVQALHTPQLKPKRRLNEKPKEQRFRKRRPRKPKIRLRSTSPHAAFPPPIKLSFLDIELIQRVLELDDMDKIKVRDYFRRNALLKAIAKLE